MKTKALVVVLFAVSLAKAFVVRASCTPIEAAGIAREAVEAKDRPSYPQSWYSFDATPTLCKMALTKFGYGYAFYPVLEIDNGYDNLTYTDVNRVVFVSKDSCIATWISPEDALHCVEF